MRLASQFPVPVLSLLLFACGCGDLEINQPLLNDSAKPTGEPELTSIQAGTAQAAGNAGIPVAYGAAQTILEDQDPEAMVAEYLEATRVGDPTTVNRLLTTVARQKAQELDIALSPPVSETAKFEVLGHEFIDAEQTISHVASRWSEVGAGGERESANIVWVARREAEGWRIAGMIVRLAEDQPPMPFNFEDPEGILRQQHASPEDHAQGGE